MGWLYYVSSIYKFCLSVCMSDHNSWNPWPIYLKFWLVITIEPQEFAQPKLGFKVLSWVGWRLLGKRGFQVKLDFQACDKIFYLHIIKLSLADPHQLPDQMELFISTVLFLLNVEPPHPAHVPVYVPRIQVYSSCTSICT